MKNMKKVIAAILAIIMALLMCISAIAENGAEPAPQESEQIETPKQEEPKAEPTEAPKQEEPTEAPETEEPKTEPTEEPKNEPTEEPKSEPTDTPATDEPKPTEAPAEENVETDTSAEEQEIDLSKVSIDVHYVGGNKAKVGDTMTLEATITGLEGVHYSMQWQYFDGEWHNIKGANSATYSFVADRTNATYLWQIVVTID